jgi:hypothetical protein
VTEIDSEKSFPNIVWCNGFKGNCSKCCQYLPDKNPLDDVAQAIRPEVKWHCLVLSVFWAHASGQMTSTVKTPHRNSHGKDQNMSPSSRNLE